MVDAIPSGRPARPIGTVFAYSSTSSCPPYCNMPSVWIRPAAAHTARIPYLDHSDRDRRRHVLEVRAGECAIERDAAPRAEAHEADEPPAAGDHPALGDAVRQVPRRVDVQPMHRPQSLQPDLLQRGGELSAGVVDEDVYRAEPLADGVEETLDLFRLPDVAGHREHLAAGRLELCPHGLERFGTRVRRSRRSRRSGSAPGPWLAPMPVPPPVTMATRPARASSASGDRNSSSMRVRVCRSPR